VNITVALMGHVVPFSAIQNERRKKIKLDAITKSPPKNQAASPG